MANAEYLLGCSARAKGLMVICVCSSLQDRTYVPQHNKTKVYDMGLQIFRDTIARHERVKDRLKYLLLENIRRERDGELVDRSLMRDTLSMLVDLGVDGTSVYEVRI